MRSVVRRIADDDEHRCGFLILDALRIRLREEHRLLRFRQIERIDEADALKRHISPYRLVKLMFNVETSDVVGQQHHLVAVQFRWVCLVFLLQSDFIKCLHNPDDEVAGANKRIDDMHAFIRKRTSELSFQNLFDTLHHEVDNRLRRIDDAVRIGNLHGEPLEKLFVDSVEEPLFL